MQALWLEGSRYQYVADQSTERSVDGWIEGRTDMTFGVSNKKEDIDVEKAGACNQMFIHGRKSP